MSCKSVHTLNTKKIKTLTLKLKLASHCAFAENTPYCASGPYSGLSKSDGTLVYMQLVGVQYPTVYGSGSYSHVYSECLSVLIHIITGHLLQSLSMHFLIIFFFNYDIPSIYIKCPAKLLRCYKIISLPPFVQIFVKVHANNCKPVSISRDSNTLCVFK